MQLIVTGLLQLLPLQKTGRVKILGVGHPQRLKAYPDIPAIAETIPGYYNTGWWGIAAPAGTSKAIVDGSTAIMNTALATPERCSASKRTVSRSRPQRRKDFTT